MATLSSLHRSPVRRSEIDRVLSARGVDGLSDAAIAEPYRW
jgi:hypothetical protein